MKNIAIISPLVALLLLPVMVSAHQREQFIINGEKHEFVIGSLNEPIVVDDKTGVLLSVREVGDETAGAEEDDHSSTGGVMGLEETLKVEMIAGDVKKITDLSPVRDTPGSYQNAFYPTVATTLSYRIFGTIDETPFDYTFTCNPAGHAAAPEDTTEVKISDGVTRVLKTGSFSCPQAKEDFGFPEKSTAVVGLEAKVNSTNGWAMTGTGLGALSLLLAGYAVATRRRS